MTNYKTLKVEIKERMAQVTVSRPEALNALNEFVLHDLCEAFTEFAGNGKIRGVILTGEGKAFVAGADIASMKSMTKTDAERFCNLGHRTMNLIAHSRFPVIAAVNGFALGGGFELALACDFIYAAKSAKLGLPEVNLGLFPGFGGTQRLSRLIGMSKAKELIFSAKLLRADEALQWGIVNAVFADDGLLAETTKMLQIMVEKAPLAVALAKKVIQDGNGLSLDRGLHVELEQFPVIFATEDAKEGVSAFLEKRKPKFKGK